MRIVCLAFVVVVGCASKPKREEDQHPCDMISSRTPAPEPPGQPHATCGNGIIEEQVGACEEHCSGGCGTAVECKVECPRSREHCDGAEVGYTCESQGYAAGTMGCTSECNLDHAACVACVDGPGVRCGTWEPRGDETFVIATGDAVAVFVRDASGGRLQGATVTADLRTKPLANLPRVTLAAAAVDGGLAFVDAKRRLGVIDAAGRTKMLGPIGDGERILIFRETDRPGGIAVLGGDYPPMTLAMFGTGELPRHFFFDTMRIVALPGDDVVLLHGNDQRAYHLNGTTLEPLVQTPAGVSFAFTYPTFTDKIGERTISRSLVDKAAAVRPKGLGAMAVAGAGSSPAFGGTLFARRDDRGHTMLSWAVSQ